jgi:hypothetical protein
MINSRIFSQSVGLNRFPIKDVFSVTPDGNIILSGSAAWEEAARLAVNNYLKAMERQEELRTQFLEALEDVRTVFGRLKGNKFGHDAA